MRPVFSGLLPYAASPVKVWRAEVVPCALSSAGAAKEGAFGRDDPLMSTMAQMTAAAAHSAITAAINPARKPRLLECARSGEPAETVGVDAGTSITLRQNGHRAFLPASSSLTSSGLPQVQSNLMAKQTPLYPTLAPMLATFVTPVKGDAVVLYVRNDKQCPPRRQSDAARIESDAVTVRVDSPVAFC